MCHCRVLILIVMTFLTAPGTKAQKNFNYTFHHINQADGLLHNDVLSIAQDKKGFIWIATPNGLQRFDGTRFVHYPELLSNPALGRSSGANIFADKKNNLIWINNGTNIEKMELGKNNFTIYDIQKLSKEPSFSFDSYRDINNREWFLGHNAVFYYDSVDKRIPGYYFNILSVNSHRSSFIVTDSTGNYTWAAAGDHLFLFDKKTKRVYSDNFNPGHHPLLQSSLDIRGQNSSRFIMIDSRQNIWVTTWGEMLYKYDNGTKKLSRYSLSAIKIKEDGNKKPGASPLINCMLEDDNQTIWIGTENAGLLRYSHEKDNFDYAIARERNNESIRYDYKIYSLLQDKEQNIWVGTDKGISIFNPYRQYFRSIRHQENNPSSIGKSEIISFTQTTNGEIYIGTWGGGISIYDNKFQFKKNIFFNGAAQKNFVWSFLQVNDKTLWIGCQHGHLLIYDIITGEVQTIRPPEMEGSTIRCMEKDGKGNILFGLHNGKIVKWDKARNKFLAHGSGGQDSLSIGAAVNSILIDKLQHYWVSTIAGLKEFDPEKSVYTDTWLPNKDNPEAISGLTCQGMEEYNDSTLLIGTIHGGLNFFNKRTKTFSHLTTADGMPANTIYAIKKDSAGFIWFTTDYGLYKLRPADKKVIPYKIETGLVNSSLYSNKFYSLQDGQWLTFSVTEAISFFPYKTEYQDDRQPTIEITGFKLFDKAVFIDSLLYENKPVRLSYKENFLTIEFTALIFSSHQQTNYYYRLIGIDKNWVNGGTNRFASYTDLQPGEYIFEVKAENGSSTVETTALEIIITPPFWKTWWFRSAGILLIIIIVYGLIRKRIKRIQHEAEMKQTIAETQMMALRAQMNPHFIFNCLNSIDNLIQTDQKEKATDYLAKFAQLIRAILENSKSNTIPCWKDLEALKLYLQMEELRWDKKITCHLAVADEIQNGDYKVPPMILQPFVENAIHHGLLNKVANDKKLDIDVKLEGNKIKYTVSDNGVGRVQAGEYKKLNMTSRASFGMQITKDRINLFNQHTNGSVKITDLYNEHRQPGGTRVEVWLTTQPGAA
jgi:ligand-binding sensor domain-containing protein